MLAHRNAELQARLDYVEGKKREAEAFSIVEQAHRDGHLFDAGHNTAMALATWLAEEDVDGTEREFQTPLGQKVRMTRTQMFQSVLEEVPQADLFTEKIPSEMPEGTHLLPSSTDPRDGEDEDTRKAHEDVERFSRTVGKSKDAKARRR